MRKIQVMNGHIHEFKVVRHLFSDDTTELVASPAELLFPKAAGEAYYKVGDFIFSSEFTYKVASRMYKEFEVYQDFSWGQFLMFLLEVDKISVTKKIEAIHGSGPGAIIVMKPYMRVSDTELIPLTLPRGEVLDSRSFNELQDDFMWYDLYAQLSFWIPVGEVVVTLVTLPLGGATKTAIGKVMMPLFKKFGGKVVRQLIRIGGARLARIVVGKVTQKTASFVFGVAKDAITETLKQYLPLIQRNTIKGLPNPAVLATLQLESIVKKAVRDAVAKNIKSELVSGIESIIPGAEGADIIPKSIQERVTEFVTKKLLSTVLSPFTEFLEAAIAATPVGNDTGTYNEALKKAFADKMNAFFSTKTLGDLTGEAFKELVSAPELAIE